MNFCMCSKLSYVAICYGNKIKMYLGTYIADFHNPAWSHTHMVLLRDIESARNLNLSNKFVQVNRVHIWNVYCS